MNWARLAGSLALGTGVVLTLCLSVALFFLEARLPYQPGQEIPPGLPGLILALAVAAGSFWFLGWRLRRGRTIRLAAYQATLGLVVLSLVALTRQALGFFGAEWSGLGSIMLGTNGLALSSVGLLVLPPTRRALVYPEAPEAETEDLQVEVETLVKEIQETYRRHPVPPPSLTTWQVIREGFLRPARAFREIKERPHLELLLIIPLLAIVFTRMTPFGQPDLTGLALLRELVDFTFGVTLYGLGKAAMFWGIARLLGRSLKYASALIAFMIIDFPSATTAFVSLVWPGQYAWSGVLWYNRVGLGPLLTTDLYATAPVLYSVLASVDYLHIWTFGLWWLAIAVLMHVRPWVALLLTLLTFPASHTIVWCIHNLMALI